MLNLLLKLLRQSPPQMGRSRGVSVQGSRLRNAKFASFISSHGGITPIHADCHEARLRRRKLFRRMLTVAVTAGAAWVVVESAHALTMF